MFFRSPIGAVLVKAAKLWLVQDDEQPWVDVSQVCLTLPRLRPEFSGYRVVQISDFHIGTWINRRRLDEAIDLVNEQRPDLVAITGDFVTRDPERYAEDLTAALRRLSARDAAVAVLGNHDHWSDPQVIRQVLRDSGVLDLSNRVHTIRRGEAVLHIAGVDDHMEELDRIDSLLEQLPDHREPAILLAHEPDFADIAVRTGRFDLQISGHTHGGQVCLPLIGPPLLPRCGRKYPSGLYRLNGMALYTNRGLGTAELKLRFNCRPEITVFTLEPGMAFDSF